MSIHLFGNFSGDRQWSMLRYGFALRKAIRLISRGRETVKLYMAPGGRPGGQKWRAYWSRYFLYPRHASTHSGTINHIVDHGYSYLIHSLPRERTVITCHDMLVSRIRRGLVPEMQPTWSAGIFDRQIQGLKEAAHVIAVSEQTKSDLQEFLNIPEERISVIRSGIDANFLPLSEVERQEARVRWGLTGRRWTLLHVSGQAAYKNVMVILKAVALLRDRGMDVQFVRAGAALTPAEESEAERLGLSDRLILPGAVSQDQLCELYNIADVFVFPSLWEGFGWPPLEAMACGTPVVASEAGALGETLGDAGLTVDPQDPNALATAIAAVLNDPELAKNLRQKGFKNTARFSWKDTAERTWAVYEKVLKDAA